jgi:hypothetical protein
LRKINGDIYDMVQKHNILGRKQKEVIGSGNELLEVISMCIKEREKS